MFARTLHERGSSELLLPGPAAESSPSLSLSLSLSLFLLHRRHSRGRDYKDITSRLCRARRKNGRITFGDRDRLAIRLERQEGCGGEGETIASSGIPLRARDRTSFFIRSRFSARLFRCRRLLSRCCGG
jgi:hypothetical protein